MTYELTEKESDRKDKKELTNQAKMMQAIIDKLSK